MSNERGKNIRQYLVLGIVTLVVFAANSAATPTGRSTGIAAAAKGRHRANPVAWPSAIAPRKTRPTRDPPYAASNTRGTAPIIRRSSPARTRARSSMRGRAPTKNATPRQGTANGRR